MASFLKKFRCALCLATRRVAATHASRKVFFVTRRSRQKIIKTILRPRAQKIEIAFSDDMRVRKNSSRSANVRAYGACAAAERDPFQKQRAPFGALCF